MSHTGLPDNVAACAKVKIMNTNEVGEVNIYEAVLRDLRTRLAAGPPDSLQAQIKNAIEALEALKRASQAETSTAAGNIFTEDYP